MKAHNCLLITQTDIQIRYCAAVPTTGPCVSKNTFSLDIEQKRAFIWTKQINMISLASFYGVQATCSCTVIRQKAQFLYILSCRFEDILHKLFSLLS